MSDSVTRGHASGVLRFGGHFLQMVAAMLVGMLVLDPLWQLVLPGPTGRGDVRAVVAATDMALGMAVWMGLRRHSLRSIVEMAAAMFAPFLVLLIPYWIGAMSGAALMVAAHVVMLPAMLAVMVHRRAEYTRPHRHPRGTRRAGAGKLLRVAVAAIVAVALPLTVGLVSARSYLSSLYAPAADTTVPVSVRDRDRPVHDPAKPTAVVLLANQGANVGDVLAPYETFAATGAFNLYTVAPERRRVPLTGGLDLVPDLSTAELAQRLSGRAPDVVAVPQVPDPDAPVTEPLRTWLTQQSRAGAIVLGVCIGAEVLASAGLLDGRDATSHWFRLGALEDRYTDVRWQRATRYVDDGTVITTGGVLSGIDGTLRVIERLLGTSAARSAAAAVGWANYSPGTPAPLPRSRFGARDMVAGVNLAFRPKQDIGVVLTNGVGEIELASIFGSYTEAAYAARMHAVGWDGATPVRSRHGLIFVPRAGVFAGQRFDRLLVPGVEAARRPAPQLDARAHAALGATVEYPHAEGGFAFDTALHDMARQVDVASARWRAKTLEYPATELRLSGPAWPWGATLLPLLYALFGFAAVAAVTRVWRMRRAVRPSVAPPGGPASTAADTAAERDPASVSG